MDLRITAERPDATLPPTSVDEPPADTTAIDDQVGALFRTPQAPGRILLPVQGNAPQMLPTPVGTVLPLSQHGPVQFVSLQRDPTLVAAGLEDPADLPIDLSEYGVSPPVTLPVVRETLPVHVSTGFVIPPDNKTLETPPDLTPVPDRLPVNAVETPPVEQPPEPPPQEPPPPPTFGEGTRTVYNWMKTDPSMQGKMLSYDDVVALANNENAPPDLRAAAQAMTADGGATFKDKLGGKDNIADTKDFAKFIANDDTTPLSDADIQTVAVLGRHQKDLPKNEKDIQAKIDDPKTPDDLRQALQQMQKNPSLIAMIDAGKNGKVDGKFSGKDIERLTERRGEIREFNQQQAAIFVDNYIPSDETEENPKPRPMTGNDAMRELYRYSDYLPKHISRETLEDIVNGTGNMGKMPPQVIAAAQYMLQHPDAWSQVAPNGSISRGHLCDAIAQDINLNPDERETIKTLQDNRSTFFGDGTMNREKLQKIANDPNASEAVKKAANQLLNDPLLFGMLDNGKRGHSGDPLHAADDGKISGDDLDKFVGRLKTKDQPPPEIPPSHEPTTPEAQAATYAMQAGIQDQPEEKKSKGGGFMKFLQGVLKVFSKIVEIVGQIVSAVVKIIPGVGNLIAGAISVGSSFISGQLKVASVAAGGGSKEEIRAAEKEAGLDLAGAAISGIGVPGMGAVVRGGVNVAEHAIEAGATRTVKEVLPEAIKDTAKDQVTDAAYNEADKAYHKAVNG
ncbi:MULTISPECIES: HrpF/NolX family T3SS translocon protein [unclassified Cupriavidus]|uniref:HrpF/NolX family T3SS translocon protein n=1 Tax=unclassified Cupriavidus TaxID=2640874 RepID=UPI00313CF41E